MHVSVAEEKAGSSKPRFVSVIRYGSRLYCLDSVCYHAGGPLTAGDIEECNGEPCIICPWHAYPVALASGDKLYRATERNAEGKLVPAGWRSVGARQRTHEVKECADGLYVRLRTGGAFESDSYAHNAACGARCTTAHKPSAPRSGSVLNVPLHSSRGADGHALR